MVGIDGLVAAAAAAAAVAIRASDQAQFLY
jgi:hypothetical protein